MAITPQKPAIDTRQGRISIALSIISGHAIKHIYVSGLAVIIMPQIKIGLGLTKTQFGSLATARQITHSLSTFTSGYLADRYSSKAALILCISLGLMGVSHSIAGFAPHYLAILGAMFLVGIGPALYHPPALSTLSHRFPDLRGLIVSLHGTAANVGGLLGPITVVGLLTFMTWQYVLKISVFPAILAGILVWAIMHSAPKRKTPGVATFGEYILSVQELLKNKVVIILVLATGLRAISENAMDAYLPLYLIDDLNLEGWKVAVFLGIAQTAGIVTQPGLGYLSDRYGRKIILVPGTASIAFLSLILAATMPEPLLLIIIVARGAFGFSLHHIYIAASLDAAHGHVQSTVVALIYGASFLGTFSPLIGGLLADMYGIQSIFMYSGSVLLLSTLLLLSVRISSPKANNKK